MGKSSLAGIIFMAVLLIILDLITSGMAFAHWNEQYVDAKVIDKHVDIKSYASHGCKDDCKSKPNYIVYTDKGVFEIDVPRIYTLFNVPLIDSIFNVDSRSAEINYNIIQKKKSYRFHMYGYRINILNVYPIVTDVKEE